MKQSLTMFFLPNSVIPNTMTASSEGDSWWLHMSPERQAREKELFQKLVTHFYLVSRSLTIVKEPSGKCSITYRQRLGIFFKEHLFYKINR